MSVLLQLTAGHDEATSGESSVRGRLCLRLCYDACARTLTVCVIAARDLSAGALQQTTPTNGRKHGRQRGEPDQTAGGDTKRPSVYVKITALPRRS